MTAIQLPPCHRDILKYFNNLKANCTGHIWVGYYRQRWRSNFLAVLQCRFNKAICVVMQEMGDHFAGSFRFPMKYIDSYYWDLHMYFRSYKLLGKCGLWGFGKKFQLLLVFTSTLHTIVSEAKISRLVEMKSICKFKMIAWAKQTRFRQLWFKHSWRIIPLAK